MSLDSNQRSEYKARELKSVYVNTRGYYLKLVMKACHSNAINVYNQVGIVAINVMGTMVAPAPVQTYGQVPMQQQMMHPSMQMSPATSYGSSPAINSPYVQPQAVYQQPPYNPQPQNGMYPSAVQVNPSPVVQHQRIGSDSKIPSGLDAATTKKLMELETAKQHAIDHEDYDEAKRLKLIIDGVKASAAKFVELERQKQHAVEMEDYDTAKAIKRQIDALRAQALNQPAQPQQNGYHSTSQRQHSPHQQQHSSRQHSPHQHHQQHSPHQQPAPALYDDDRPIKPAAGATKHNQMQQPPVQPQYAQPTSNNVYDSQPFDHSATADSPIHQRQPANNHQQYDPHYQPPAQRQDHNDDRALPTMNKAPGQLSAANAQFMTDEAVVDEDTTPAAANGAAEPLSSANRKDAEQLIDLYGEPTCQQLYSKQWTHRVTGLKTINSDIGSQAIQADERTIYMSVIKVLKRTLNDKVAHVFLAATQLLETTLHTVANSVKPDELRSSMDAVVLILIEKLADVNQRVRDTADSTIILLATSRNHGPSLIPTHLLSPLKKKDENAPLPLKSRARLLLKLVLRYGLSDKTNLTSAALMQFLLPHLQHRDVSVREAMMNLCAAVAQITGVPKLDQYFRGVRGATLDTLMQRIEDVTSGRLSLAPGEEGRVNSVAPKEQHYEEEKRQQQHHQQQQQPASGRFTARQQKQHDHPHPPSHPSPRDFHVNSHNVTAVDNQPMHHDIYSQQQQQQPPYHPQHNNNDLGSDNEVNEITEHMGDAMFHDGLGESSMDATNQCQFCGLVDPEFTEEQLDLHYWQSCPMLTSCQQCEQVIEISTLNDHLLNECEVKDTYEMCTQCHQPIPMDQFPQHTQNANCSQPSHGMERCSLCQLDIPSTLR